MHNSAAWLTAFEWAIANHDANSITSLFTPSGLWRDYLAFGWTLQTIEGRPSIEQFVSNSICVDGFRNVETQIDKNTPAHEAFFSFQNNLGHGRGYIRLEGGLCKTLFTMQDDLITGTASAGASAGAGAGAGQSLPQAMTDVDEPYVLIIGGGQGGLAIGAQLSYLNVPYLIVDKHPRIGDQWRSRYQSLVLHDPVWYDHMPFIPFPDDWPVFTPKDKMADWLESYAQQLSLSVSTSTACTSARYNEDDGAWCVSLQQGGMTRTVRPTHLVFALGISGFPNIPEFPDNEIFKGQQFHSSDYQGGQELSGKRVVVIGANNSAHDIAADLAANGALPTMIQRSSTLIVRQEDYCEQLLGPLYSREAVQHGIDTDKADLLQASVPIRILEKTHRPIWDKIREQQRDYYQRLADTGFNLDFAEDGTGLGMKYRRTASGYYIDVGATAMVVDGSIGIRSGVSVERLSARGIKLNTGEELSADIVIYATGFGSMTDWVTKLINKETADRVGRCWGYGSDTKGDPGPWLGELRNMWMPTAQLGLWFMGGNLAQTRFYSKLLGLQLQGRFLGVV